MSGDVVSTFCFDVFVICESPWISKEIHDTALNFFKVTEKSLNFPQSYLWLSIPDFFWISAGLPFRMQGDKQLLMYMYIHG